MEEQEDKRGFKVQDRRRFSAEGETKEGGDAPAASSEAAGDKIQAAPASRIEDARPQAASLAARNHAREAASRIRANRLPELTFAAFLWSLSEQALAALGEVPDPSSGKVSRDLTVAQQMIDIISMLRDKTRGNLDAAGTSDAQRDSFRPANEVR